MKIPKSLAQQDRAKQLIPGMGHLLSKRPDMFSAGVWPGYYSKAQGANVWDLDGNKYIDMSIAGIGANVLGYADPDVNAAVIAAVEHGSSSSLNCPEEVELAEELCRIHPWAQMSRLTRSGGESMTVAIRIARAYTERDIVAICGYHGWHDWYLAANLGTQNALGEHLIPGLSPVGVPQALKGTVMTFNYNDLASLQKIVDTHQGKLAAIVMEPIRNFNPNPGFLEGVRALATKAQAVLIFDEISSGFRMNTGGVHGLFQVDPDMAVFSKALGNGFPIGAVIGRGDVMQAAQKTFISSTMWSERIGPVAALATIKKHREHNVGAHLMRMGKAVQEGWAHAAKQTGLDISVGGIYPLSHFGFQGINALEAKAFYIQEMLEHGFLASNLFYPMLAHQDSHVDGYLKATQEVFAMMKKHLDQGTLTSALKGAPSCAGFKRVT